VGGWKVGRFVDARSRVRTRRENNEAASREQASEREENGAHAASERESETESEREARRLGVACDDGGIERCESASHTLPCHAEVDQVTGGREFKVYNP